MKARPLYRCTNCCRKVGLAPPERCPVCGVWTFETYERFLFRFSVARLLAVMTVICAYLGISQSMSPPFIDPLVLLVCGEPPAMLVGFFLCVPLLPCIFAVAFRPNLWTYLLCLFGSFIWWFISYAMYIAGGTSDM